MAPDDFGFSGDLYPSFGDRDGEIRINPAQAEIRRPASSPRTGAESQSQPPRNPRRQTRLPQNRRPSMASSFLEGGEEKESTPTPVSPEARKKAQTILAKIGERFSANRTKSQSSAYERYQQDIAENMEFLIMGGVMSMKEVSQLLMAIEEYRKQSSESGKTTATLLAEFLRGERVEGLEGQ